MSREELATNLEPVGFLVFNTPLKADVPPTIEHLRQCNMKCAMVTGDHPLTAAVKAIESSIVRPGAACDVMVLEAGPQASPHSSSGDNGSPGSATPRMRRSRTGGAPRASSSAARGRQGRRASSRSRGRAEGEAQGTQPAAPTGIRWSCHPLGGSSSSVQQHEQLPCTADSLLEAAEQAADCASRGDVVCVAGSAIHHAIDEAAREQRDWNHSRQGAAGIGE